MIPIKDDIPTKSFPLITILLIVINIYVFVYEISLDWEELNTLVYSYGLLPTDIIHFKFKPLITHMFIHADLGHIIGNMLFLWVFGNNVEDSLGKLNYMIFYILSGLGSALLQSIVSIFSGNTDIPMIGASGAISGILAAYMRLFPYSRILAVIPPFIFLFFTLPAWFFIGYWFILQLVAAVFLPTEFGGIAWYAHIGGFVMGWFLVGIFKKRRLIL